MPHMYPPEDERSPASPFAPLQPAAGVVADDADEKGQNLAGGPKAAEAGNLGRDVVEEREKAYSGEFTGERNDPAMAEANSLSDPDAPAAVVKDGVAKAGKAPDKK